MVFKSLPILVLRTKVVSSLEGLITIALITIPTERHVLQQPWRTSYHGLSCGEACSCYLMSSGHVAYLNIEQNDRLLMVAWLRVDGIHGQRNVAALPIRQSIIPGMEPEVQG